MKAYLIIDEWEETDEDKVSDIAPSLIQAIQRKEKYYFTRCKIKVAEITNIQDVPEKEIQETKEIMKKLEEIFGDPFDDSENSSY